MTTTTCRGAFPNLDALAEAVGTELGVSRWFDVTQARIDAFAEATDDRQWIHLDAERAAAESPYGTTIAHGFLTLSLVAPVLGDVVRLDNRVSGINYGCDKVRFVSAVPADARLRGRVTLAEMDRKSPTSAKLAYDVVMEIEDEEKPAAIVRALVIANTL